MVDVWFGGSLAHRQRPKGQAICFFEYADCLPKMAEVRVKCSKLLSDCFPGDDGVDQNYIVKPKEVSFGDDKIFFLFFFKVRFFG